MILTITMGATFRLNTSTAFELGPPVRCTQLGKTADKAAACIDRFHSGVSSMCSKPAAVFSSTPYCCQIETDLLSVASS